MEIVLIIENDPVWRCCMRRAVNHIPGVEAVEAASFSEAICLIAVERPGLIIFDIDIQERLDVEALGNLRLPRLNIPLVCISSQCDHHQAIQSTRQEVTLVSKPISLRKLESIVLEKIGHALDVDSSPFGVIEYVQLACIGQHSVEIDVRGPDHEDGHIVIQRGAIWSARLGNRSPEDALFAMALIDRPQLRCHLASEDPGPRTIQSSWEAIIIESARRRDEHAHARG